MTDTDLQDALTQAIEREYAARIAGLVELQAIHMDEIRQLRRLLLLRGTGDLERAIKQLTSTEEE